MEAKCAFFILFKLESQQKGSKDSRQWNGFPPYSPPTHQTKYGQDTAAESASASPLLSTLAHQASLMTLTTLSLHTINWVKNDPFLILGTKKSSSSYENWFFFFLLLLQAVFPPPMVLLLMFTAFTLLPMRPLWDFGRAWRQLAA